MVTVSRLLEIQLLLSELGKKNKASSDGLGLYLGDGIPRPHLPSDELRSNELLSVVEELLSYRTADPIEPNV